MMDILATFWTLCLVGVTCQQDQIMKTSKGTYSLVAVIAGTFIIWRIWL